MDLTVLKTDGVIRAFKVAEIRGDRDPRVHPVGPSWRFPVEHRGTVVARCRRALHRAPDLECTCGFHAVVDLERLGDVTPIHADSVVLEVELSGTIVEHERGARAEEQTVVGILLPAACYGCGDDAGWIDVHRRFWRPLCTGCAAHCRPAAISCDEAASRIGVPVRFDSLAVERRASWRRRQWLSSAAAAVGAALLVQFWFSPRPARLPWVAVGGIAVAASIGLTAYVWSVRTSRDIGRCLTFQYWLMTLACAAVAGSVMIA